MHTLFNRFWLNLSGAIPHRRYFWVRLSQFLRSVPLQYNFIGLTPHLEQYMLHYAPSLILDIIRSITPLLAHSILLLCRKDVFIFSTCTRYSCPSAQFPRVVSFDFLSIMHRTMVIRMLSDRGQIIMRERGYEGYQSFRNVWFNVSICLSQNFRSSSSSALFRMVVAWLISRNNCCRASDWRFS